MRHSRILKKGWECASELMSDIRKHHSQSLDESARPHSCSDGRIHHSRSLAESVCQQSCSDAHIYHSRQDCRVGEELRKKAKNREWKNE